MVGNDYILINLGGGLSVGGSMIALSRDWMVTILIIMVVFQYV